MSTISLGDMQINGETEVFVLEDTLLYQKRLMTCLRTIGFKGKITIAGSVSEATNLIKTARPGLILSDWNLPDGFGIDFLKLVRSEKRFDHVPMLMVTTMDDVSKIMEAIKSGADDYIVKPFYEIDVIEKLSFAFEKRLPKENLITPSIKI